MSTGSGSAWKRRYSSSRMGTNRHSAPDRNWPGRAAAVLNCPSAPVELERFLAKSYRQPNARPWTLCGFQKNPSELMRLYFMSADRLAEMKPEDISRLRGTRLCGRLAGLSRASAAEPATAARRTVPAASAVPISARSRERCRKKPAGPLKDRRVREQQFAGPAVRLGLAGQND